MASPFRIFRKHQKTLLVVAGVLLMFVFVIGDSLSSLTGLFREGSGGDARRDPNAVAVSWNGGELTNNELSTLVFKRQLVNQFVRTLEAAGRQMMFDSGAEPRPLRVVLVGGPERPSDGVEQDVVQTVIFAEAARKAGMQISDEEIMQYLQEVGRQRVSGDQMRAILGHVQQQGRTFPVAFMMDAIREELLARNFLLSYQYAMRTVLPEEKWQDWLRANDRVVVEAAAIPVSSFLIDVKAPTEEELKEFFVTPVNESATYQTREQQPDIVLGTTELPSPTPGFAVPRKVDVHYVLAEFDKFIDKIETEITDDEIKKYYEDNKYPYFIRADSELTGSAAEGQTTGEQQSGESGASTEKSPPAGDNESAAPSGESRPAAEDGSSTGRAPGSGEFRLAAFQQEDKPAAEPADTAPGQNEAAAEEGAADQPAAPTADDKKAVEYQPFEEVRDQIRRQLAEQKVNDRLREMVSGLETELHAVYQKYLGDVLDAEATGKAVPAPPPELGDFAALAEKHGLQAGQTGPVSVLELRDLPVGKSATADENNYPFVLLAFSQELEPYQPVATFDVDNNRYLALKASDTPRKVPSLDEARNQVVQAWKMQKAAELALKSAEETAKKAQDSGKWLGDYFADDKNVKVVRTDPFSWLTIGNVSPRTGMVDSFRMSQPDGIVAPGPDFMREVFELKGNQVSAVLNHDHTIAYVVRVVEHQDTEDQLRQSFLSEAYQWYGLPVMNQSHMQRAGRILVNDFLDNVYQVQWERPADEVIREEEEE